MVPLEMLRGTFNPRAAIICLPIVAAVEFDSEPRGGRGEAIDRDSDWQRPFLEFVTGASRRPELHAELARQRTELRELIAAEAQDPLQALGARPALSTTQLATSCLLSPTA